MSFRTRLLLTSLTTLAVGLGALVVAGNVLLARRVNAETTSLLKAKAEAQVAALAISDRGVRVRLTANDHVLDKEAWIFARGRALERPAGVSPALDRAARSLGNAGRVAEVDGPSDFRLRAQPVRSPRGVYLATVVVAESKVGLEDLQHKVFLGSLVVAALVILAGGIAIRGAVGGVLRPVAEMTTTAEDWGAHDLDRRFGLGPARDELTALAATLDGLLGRIAASRRHEQRFASEMAHELRTPLAGLRARAELALRDGTVDAEREAALAAVVEQTDRLAGTIDALMAVARQELGDAGSTVDLAAVARELPDVELDVRDPVPPAEGDAELARRALSPLLDNARRHARSRVRVEVASDAVSVHVAVRDDGPGLAPGLAERAFEPGFQAAGGDGAGLGLPLARRLARSCGGDVTAGEGPGGCFVLTLPRAGD
jgi:signal transduction histidine kinase